MSLSPPRPDRHSTIPVITECGARRLSNGREGRSDHRKPGRRTGTRVPLGLSPLKPEFFPTPHSHITEGGDRHPAATVQDPGQVPNLSTPCTASSTPHHPMARHHGHRAGAAPLARPIGLSANVTGLTARRIPRREPCDGGAFDSARRQTP